LPGGGLFGVHAKSEGVLKFSLDMVNEFLLLANQIQKIIE